MTKPQFTLHKLPEGFIVTSDQKDTIGYLPVVLTRFNELEETADGDDVYDHIQNGSKIVIAQQDQIDFSSLSPEMQKEIGWFDWKKYCDLDNGKYGTNSHSYYLGFQKALELLSDRTFSSEDMRIEMERIALEIATEDGELTSGSPALIFSYINKRMQYLSQSSWKVELEMERTRYPKGDDGWEDVYTPKFTDGKIKIIKLHNNEQR
ncbi:MAG: hypothetical protein ACK5DE_09900 [Bacteroidota bacterium]